MFVRFVTGIFFLLYTVFVGAEESITGWNCEQTTENKQWRCVSQKKIEPSESSSASEKQSSQELEVRKSNSEIKDISEPLTSHYDLNTPLTVPTEATFEPPRTENQQNGWHCKADTEKSSWDCNLVGPDPQSQPRLMAEEDYSIFRIFGKPTYNQKEENIFLTLMNEFKSNPWGACVGPRKTAPPQFLADLGLRESTPMEIISDYSEIFDEEISSFMGNVDLRRADQHMMAGMATYDSVAETMDLQGHVLYSENGLALFSDTAFLKLADDKARLRNVLFISPEAPLRGRAKVAYRDSATFSYYKQANFTSCPPGNQDWIMHASRLKLNKKTGKGSAKHAWLEFKGIPFLYSPYLSFPLDNRRLTGFLTPSWDNTDRSGFGVHIPFYWNIAPNYDALFWARYFSKRGFAFGSLFRYLTETSEGSFEFELLPSDDLAGESRGGLFDNNGNQVTLADGTLDQFATTKSFRGAARFKNTTQFTNTLSSNMDLNYVSDPYYFDDLGNSLRISTASYLHSFANFSYNDQFGNKDEEQTEVSFFTQVENYQNIDIRQTGSPYQRLPQVTLDIDRDFDFMPLSLELETEYVYFHKKNIDDFFGIELDDFRSPSIIKAEQERINRGENVDPLVGQRFNIKPSISFPYETASFFITPKISVQHTQYWLTNRQADKPDRISRTLPIASLDTGLFFEREFGDQDSGYIHTIEPRLFYVYIPFKDQNDIPLFDTGEFDFTGSQLFRENRFSGSDRIQDTNQLTYALTSRLLESDSGRELLNFTVGQIVYFQDRKVTLTENDDPETNTLSNLVVGLSGRITDHLTFSSGAQWNPDTGDFDRYQAALRYRGPDRQLLNIGYRFRRSEFLIDKNTGFVSRDSITNKELFRKKGIDQFDVSFLWPVYEGWSVIGRWQYSFLDKVTLDSFLGIELDNCCWRFRILGRYFVSNLDSNTVSDNIEPETAIFFQFELKGLSSFGEDLDIFLERQINGYRRYLDE